MRILLFLILLIISRETLFGADTKPYIFSIIPENKEKLMKYELDNTFNDIYSKSSLWVDNYSNQTILGRKIFNYETTISSNLYISGKLGIGTDSPSKRIEISDDNISTTIITGILIRNSNITANSRAGILFENYDNFGSSIWSPRTGSTAGALVFGTNSGSGTAETNIAERMRINENGNVGIGNISPGYLLTMETSGGGYYSATDHQWHNGSEKQIKDDITDNDIDVIVKLKDLKIKKYKYFSEKEIYPSSAPYHIGFIADDNGTDLIFTGIKKDGQAIGDCIGFLLAVTQKQQMAIEDLTKRVEQLEKK